MSKKLDIIVLTALKNNYFFQMIDSVIKYNKVKNYNFYICYTGKNDYEMDLIRSYCDNKKLDYMLVRDDYHFAANCNKLVDMGTSKYLLFINDDVKLQSNAIDKCLKEYSSKEYGSKIGTIGIKLLYPDGTVQCAGQYLKSTSSYIKGAGHLDAHKENVKETSNSLVVGNTFAFCMVNRNTFVDLGKLDERFKVCFEDVIFNCKAYTHGYINICMNTIEAIHYESSTRRDVKLVDKKDVDLFFREVNRIMLFEDEKKAFFEALKDYLEKKQ